VDRFGLSTTDERIAAIKQLEFPTTFRDLETFIGICNYHREHIPYYARIVLADRTGSCGPGLVREESALHD
jgi:hypothetical protein